MASRHAASHFNSTNYHTALIAMVTLDFETKAIDGPIPPEPVGVAIKEDGKPSVYLAWGHPTGNNISFEAAKSALSQLWNHPLLFHNAQFDIGVAMKWFGLPFPKHYDDTLFLLFLNNPRSESLSLKPAAWEHLGVAPDEQADLMDYILTHVRVNGKKPSKKTWGAHISEAPAHMVDPYARGDVDRTYALYQKFYPEWEGKYAYKTELELLPILLRNTFKGIRLDRPLLTRYIEEAVPLLKSLEEEMLSILGVDIDLDSPKELMVALQRKYPDAEFLHTAKGALSTSKESLNHALSGLPIAGLANRRGTLSTFINTYLLPWEEYSKEDSRLHFSWNQVRNDNEYKGRTMGTRTGRMSSVPSLLNVPKPVDGLPNIRSLLLPEEGERWLKGDNSQQEVRIFAHYEQADLYNEYVANPNLKVYERIQEMIRNQTGRSYDKPAVKAQTLGMLFGEGPGLIAKKLGIDYEEACMLKYNFRLAIPGARKVEQAIRIKWDRKEPIRTLAGRPYLREEATKYNPDTGEVEILDLTYKGINVLTQGGGADIIKRSIINLDKVLPDRFLLAVHDENNISGQDEEIPLMREAMEDLKSLCDVPIVTEFKCGNNYGELE